MIKVSVRTLAEIAGCSTATVSLALNNHPRIPLRTKRRIQKLARAHGYLRNGKIKELMAEVRSTNRVERQSCLGLVSLYNEREPWRQHLHLKDFTVGAKAEAERLGYGLEHFWLKDSAMSLSRLKTILESRRINGLVCLGAATVGEPFPKILSHLAVVLNGVSIPTPMHRVMSSFHRDMLALLKKLQEFGYNRPGMIIDPVIDVRSSFGYSSAYLLHRERQIHSPHSIPILVTPRFGPAELGGWLRKTQPDAIIIQHQQDYYFQLRTYLAEQNKKVPADIGLAQVATVSLPGLSGIAQNHHLMGTRAVYLLVGRLLQGELGVPKHPMIEILDGEWVEGETLVAH